VFAGKVWWGNVLDASVSGNREPSIRLTFIDNDSNREFRVNHSKIACRLHLVGGIWGTKGE